MYYTHVQLLYLGFLMNDPLVYILRTVKLSLAFIFHLHKRFQYCLKFTFLILLKNIPIMRRVKPELF